MSSVLGPRGISASAKLQGFLPPAELSPTDAPAAGLAEERLGASPSGGSAGSSGPTGGARRILGSSRQRHDPSLPALRPPAGSCGPSRQALLPGSFLHSSAPGRPLGPTGDRGSGLVRRLSGDWASVVVAEPARASREQTNEDGDEPAARSKKNSPESRREKPGSGGRQFGVVNKVYSKQRGS